MISKASLRAAAAVLLVSATAQAALGQREVDLFFGIAGELMRQGVQAEQANKQRALQLQQQQAAAAAELAARQAYEQEFYTRAQTALKSLGFYTMEVDGKTGPGTRAAIAAYQAAFSAVGTFDDDALYELEWRAAEGWRSLAEAAAAQAGGFANRADYVKAKEGGFSSASVYQAAVSSGFADAQVYDVFLQSGAPDKKTFDAQAAEVAALEAATDLCLGATQAQDWVAALAPCYDATRAKPNDVATKVALETVLRGAESTLTSARANLEGKRAELAALLGDASGSNADLVTLRREINDLAEDVLFVELHLQASQCADLVSREMWREALPACYVEVSIDHLAGATLDQAQELIAAISADRDLAKRGLEKAEAELAAETSRLALADAKAKASKILADVSAYSEGGNQFERGIDVARELVALRGAAAGEDAALIETHAAQLMSLLETDQAYVEAALAMAEARRAAEQAAMLGARREAEMLDAFMLDYIGRNVTSEKIASLLPLSEALAETLTEGNGERITAAQASTRRALDSFGLGDELADFAATFSASRVSAEDLDVAEAQSATQEKARETAKAAAETLLSSIEVYSNAGGKFTSPVAVARGLTSLKAALGESSLADLKLAHENLAALVAQEPDYVADQTRRSNVSDVALANAIALAGDELARINDFLLAYISSHLADDNIESVVELQLEVEAALAAPASAEIVRTLGSTTASISQMELAEDLGRFLEEEDARSEVADAPTASNGLAVTLANAELLEGAHDDFLVLRNSVAPHLVYDLLGNLRVDGGIADACWLHAAPADETPLLMARTQLATMGIGRLETSHCNDPLLTADLVMLRRGDFLAMPPSDAHPIIAAFEDARLRLILQVKGEDAVQESARLAEQAASIVSGLENGTIRGFGLLQITGGKEGICPVVADLMPHNKGLAQLADVIAFLVSEPRFMTAMSVEEAFVAAQRGRCSAVYASAADLRALSEGMVRAGIAASVAPLWVEADEIDLETTRLAELSAQQVQAQQASAALAAAKSADMRTAVEKRQAELRAEYQDRATGSQKDVGDLVREFVQSGRSSGLQDAFPQFAKHLRDLSTNKWVITGVQDELQDYGTATWQNREVEALLVKVTLERENAILGLYAHDCVVLGYLIDREFRVTRDPVEASCGDDSGMADWEKGRAFSSVWHLTQ